MHKKFLINIGSGYFFKFIQILSGLVTVPILTSTDGLGLAGYGQLVAALSWVSLLSLSLDGFRLIASKQMGSQKHYVFQELTKTLIIFLLLISVIALPLLFFSSKLPSLLGLFEDNTFIILLLLYFMSEQILYILEQYFHSLYKTFIVNYFNAAESIIRLILIVYIFGFVGGTQTNYLCIFSGTYFFKFACYFIFILYENKDSKIEPPSYSYASNFLSQSIPLTFKGVISFFVFRFSVVYANKYLSSEAAAVFSIIFVTLRGYLSQMFVNVIRPMIIPAFSVESFSRMADEKLNKYIHLIVLFELFTLFSVSLIATTTPFWLKVWLDSNFQQYQDIFSLSIWILGLEVAYSLKTLALISQGFSSRLTLYSVFFSCLYLLLFFFLQHLHIADLRNLTTAIIFYVALYNGWAINYLFSSDVSQIHSQNITALFYLAFSVLNYYLLIDYWHIFYNPFYSLLAWFLMLVAMMTLNWSSFRYSLIVLKKISI